MAQFGAPNFLSVIDAYEAGSNRRERNRLAELDTLGRELQGKALGGDQNALAQLGQVSPQAYMQTKQFTTEQKQQFLKDFARSAYDATTPEKYAAVVDRFKSQGHTFDPGEDAFENRQSMINQVIDIGDRMGMDLRREEAKRAQANADRGYALDVQQFNAGQRNADRNFGLQQQALNARTRGQVTDVGGKRVLIDPQTGETIKELGTSPSSMPKAGGPMTASMLKLQRETESGIVDLQNTKAVLGRALELAPKAFSGMGAGTRAYLGSRLPDGAVPDFVADKAGSDATTEFGNIMSMEAIQSMSNSLKGATTDFELRKFEQVLSDPSVPPNIKIATINRMLALADSKLALEQQRLDEFGAEMPGAQPDAGGGLQPGVIEDGYRYNGGNPADPSSWEPAQ